MLFPLFLDASTLLFLFLLDTLSLLASALLVLLLLRFTCFASLLLLCLALLLPGLFLFFLAALSLLLLCLLSPFSLAFFLTFLFQLGLSLLPASVGLQLPLLLGFAPSLFLLSREFGANFLYPVFAHFGQALLPDQGVEQRAHGLRDLAIDVAALASAFNQGCGDSGVLGQQRGVAVGLAVDKLLEGGEQVSFGGLQVHVRIASGSFSMFMAHTLASNCANKSLRMLS